MSTIPFPLFCPRLRERAAPRAPASMGHVVSSPLCGAELHLCPALLYQLGPHAEDD